MCSLRFIMDAVPAIFIAFVMFAVPYNLPTWGPNRGLYNLFSYLIFKLKKNDISLVEIIIIVIVTLCYPSIEVIFM